MQVSRSGRDGHRCGPILRNAVAGKNRYGQILSSDFSKLMAGGKIDSPPCTDPLWRGGLPPLGCAAAPKPFTPVQSDRPSWHVYDCFAAEREQAPSPQKQH